MKEDSLNQFLVMLAKLKLNKLIFITILFATAKCSPPRQVLNTEIICPDIRVMVRFASAEEVRRGIKESLIEKMDLDTDDNYTAVRMSDGRSFVIKKIPPEEAIKCKINEIPMPALYKDYKQYY